MLTQESHNVRYQDHYFLTYINDLADELWSNTRLFADNTCLFSVVHNGDSSAAELNNGLGKIGTGRNNGK